MTSQWPTNLPAVQLRIARPTDRFEEVKRFYTEGLGLPIIGGFEDHDGYTGVMVGLPGKDTHLEITHHASGSPGDVTDKEHLLVFYIPDQTAINKLVQKLNDMGYPSVEPENPWWLDISTTIADPDGWRIVLVHGAGYR